MKYPARTILLLMLSLPFLFSVNQLSQPNLASSSNSYNLFTSNDIIWSNITIDSTGSMNITVPHDNMYIDGWNVSFSNFRKQQETIGIETDFAGAIASLGGETYLAMSFDVAVRSKIYGFKVVIKASNSSYPVDINLYQANETNNNYPESNPFHSFTYYLPTSAETLGNLIIPLDTPLTLPSGMYYFSLEYSYSPFPEDLLFWGFIQDEESYPGDGNTDFEDEGLGLIQDPSTGGEWILHKDHLNYNVPNQTDETVDFTLSYIGETYIVPSDAHCKVNGTTVEDITTGYGKFTSNSTVFHNSSNVFIDISARIPIVFTAEYSFRFRNILLTVISSPEKYIDGQSCTIVISCKDFQNNTPLAETSIKFLIDGEMIAVRETDSNGLVELDFKAPSAGKHIFSATFTGGSGLTNAELSFDIDSNVYIPPIPGWVYLSLIMSIVTVTVIGIIIWRLYFGGWKAPFPSQVYVITPVGLTVFEKQFAEQEIDSQLISGLLTAISSFSEVLSVEQTEKVKDNLKTIQKGELVIQLEWGMQVMLAGILPYNSYAVRRKFRRFLNSFEIKFSKQLENFMGNLSDFDGADDVFSQFFVKPEK